MASKTLLIPEITIVATLLQSAFHPGPSAALMFLASVLLYGGVSALDRWKNAELDGIRKEIGIVKSKLDGLMIAKGFGR